MPITIFSQYAVEGKNPEKHIEIYNSSFEDYYLLGKHIGDARLNYWISCGFISKSPPTIQVDGSQMFYKDVSAAHGKTHLNMVVKSDSTWEGISQKITEPLNPGISYYFSAQLCFSKTMKSPMHLSDNQWYEESFARPVIIRIRGGQSACDESDVILETKPIRNIKWKKYVFEITPAFPINSLTIEAYYDPRAGQSYGGNVCIDDLSPIYIKNKVD